MHMKGLIKKTTYNQLYNALLYSPHASIAFTVNVAAFPSHVFSAQVE